MTIKVYVDGQHGTTGIEVLDHLKKAPHVELMTMPYAQRRDDALRQTYLNEADVVILCLPESASKEAVALIHNAHVKVIDASTAFRTDPEWVYGLPELSKTQAQKIQSAKRVANPGCHATAAILTIAPLVQKGVLDPSYPVHIESLTGYSGGGKAMIEQYEAHFDDTLLSPRPYALTLQHKHLPEMKTYMGLTRPPLFVPIVNPYYKGLGILTTFYMSDLNGLEDLKGVKAFFETCYADTDTVTVYGLDDEIFLRSGFMDCLGCNHTNQVELFVLGNDTQVLLFCRLDNLGKGASTAAIQNMNLMMGRSGFSA